MQTPSPDVGLGSTGLAVHCATTMVRNTHDAGHSTSGANKKPPNLVASAKQWNPKTRFRGAMSHNDPPITLGTTNTVASRQPLIMAGPHHRVASPRRRGAKMTTTTTGDITRRSDSHQATTWMRRMTATLPRWIRANECKPSPPVRIGRQCGWIGQQLPRPCNKQEAMTGNRPQQQHVLHMIVTMRTQRRMVPLTMALQMWRQMVLPPTGTLAMALLMVLLMGGRWKLAMVPRRRDLRLTGILRIPGWNRIGGVTATVRTPLAIALLTATHPRIQ